MLHKFDLEARFTPTHSNVATKEEMLLVIKTLKKLKFKGNWWHICDLEILLTFVYRTQALQPRYTKKINKNMKKNIKKKTKNLTQQ